MNAKFWAWKILDFFEKQTPAYSWELRCRLAYPYMLICLSPLNICTRSVWMQRMPSDALHYNTCNAETCYLKHLGYRLKRYIRSRDLSNLVASILGLNDFGLISRQLCWIQPRWPYFVRFRWWHRLLLAVLHLWYAHQSYTANSSRLAIYPGASCLALTMQKSTHCGGCLPHHS